MKKFKIFYSWQSDLPGNKTRNFIRDCIDEAIELAEESETIEAERDEATKDTTGSPNIVTTLFSKIDECDLFVADVSLCFTSNITEDKKSPNPNVLLELGYAVKTLGWERVICLCNTDFGDKYPFDIAHNRITTFSLEGKSKNEVKNDIAKIIFFDVRTLRKTKPRAKVGEAIHIVGTYDFEECIVKEALVPTDIKQQRGYLYHNVELLKKATMLLSEIQDLNSQVNFISGSNKSVTLDLTEILDITRKNDEFKVPSKLFKTTEIPMVWRDIKVDTRLIKDWLDVDVSEDFFCLGELKHVIQNYNPFNNPPTIEGTEEEKEKYEKLRQLSRCLTRLETRTRYLKTFDEMVFVPIAIQNISALQDENIHIVLSVDDGEIIEPSERLICPECEGLQWCICRDDDDNDVGIICELFGLKEDGFIHTENIPYNPARHAMKMPKMMVNGYPQKSEEDYALELQEFIAKTNRVGCYEFDVSSLRPGECKWLCCGLLIKPVGKKITITYHIYSTHSTGDLGGKLEFLAI